MGILADSAIVGAATFLVGSVLMGLSIKQEGKDVKWWPYVGTFIAGSLGFYLVAVNDVIEVKNTETEARCKYCKINDPENCMYFGPTCLDAESFSAEDRKIRRRSRISWTKGFDPAFIDDFGKLDWGKVDYKHDCNSYFVEGQPDYAYHIQPLPEGYYIHLYRGRNRSDEWYAFAKSPKDSKSVYMTSNKKSEITEKILDWYNTSTVKPKGNTKLSPIEKMMLQQGMISDTPTIKRTEIKGYNITRFIDGKRTIVNTVPTEYQWYAFGGSGKLPVFKIASLKGTDLEIFTTNNNLPVLQDYEFAHDFIRGLMFMDCNTVGKESSIDKYNKDSKKWVSSFPAWFQNVCKQDVRQMSLYRNSYNTYYINGEKFCTMKNDIIMVVKENYEGLTPLSNTLTKKMRAKAAEWTGLEFDSIKGKERDGVNDNIFYQLVEKYQPQNISEYTKYMKSWVETAQMNYSQTRLYRKTGIIRLNKKDPFGIRNNESPRTPINQLNAAKLFLRRFGKKK